MSYSIVARQAAIQIHVTVPSRTAPGSLRLRLRLPDGKRIASLLLDGKPYYRYDRASGTIDLSGLTGRLDLTAARD